MKKLFLLLALLWPFAAFAQIPPTVTPNLGLLKPCLPGDPGCNPLGEPYWGPMIHIDLDTLDAKVPTLNLFCSLGDVPVWGADNKFSICAPAAAGAGHSIWDSLGTFTARGKLRFLGGGVTIIDNAGNDSTDITVAGMDATVFRTNASNTQTAGDQNFAAAASLTLPRATGAAPTAAGRCAYDNTSNRLKCGFNGSTVTLAITSEIQQLNANLTAFSGLTGVPNGFPMFTGLGTATVSVIPDCANTGGQGYHMSSGKWTCDAGSTGLSGATSNQGLFATAATGFASFADLTRTAGGVIQMPNGIEVGNVSTNYWDIDATSVTGHKTLTLLNLSGTVRPSTGAFTNGNIVKTDASGFLVDGGAAGTGDVTLVGVQELTHKTIKATGYSTGDNTVNLPIVASFDGGALVADGTNCQDPVKATINSGPTQYVILCATPNSAIIDAAIIGIKQAVTTIRVRLKANDTANTKTLDGTFKAQCRPSGTLPSATWGTTQVVSITLTNLNTTYEGLTAAITPNGTCSLGSDLYIRYNATGGSNSATTRILGLTIEQLS